MPARPRRSSVPSLRAVSRTALALLAVVSVGCTAVDPAPRPRSTDTSGPAPTSVPSPTTTASELRLELRRASGRAVGRPLRPGRVAGPAEGVRAALEDLLDLAFVDPERWGDGTFPGLGAHFAGAAREEAVRDLRRLTVGPASETIQEVRPSSASVVVKILADRAGHPVAAFATVDLAATAFADEARGRIRHHGRYVLRRSGGRWRIVSYDVRGRVPRPAELRTERTATSFLPGLPSRNPMVVLVIGSDARPDRSVSRSRADSIHLVGVDPATGRASVLGIPRDAWVPIPGFGTDKINAALVRGGPELLVSTVERLADGPIDAYVLTGFEGFQAVVDAVGGLDIVVPFPIEDRFARADFDRGPEHLSGREALAFARARHALPNGDFGRSLNQGRLLIAAVSAIRDQLARRGTVALVPWMLAGAGHLRSDLRLQEMVGLALAAAATRGRDVTNAVATGHVATVAGKSVVLLDGRGLAMLRDLARDGLLSR